MLFKDEKILILHPGKCAGTTIEHLFLRTLRNTGLAELLGRPCFRNSINNAISDECLVERLNSMVGYLAPKYAINGIANIYLQHADIRATISILCREYTDSLFKISFVRNPYPRILSAFYYNGWDKRMSFRDFVLNQLKKCLQRNEDYTLGHFGELHRYTHLAGKQYVDFIGTVENIEQDVQRLSELVGVELELNREQRHARTVAAAKYPHYSAAYNDLMVEHVRRLYRTDLELFGYEFERQLDFSPVS